MVRDESFWRDAIDLNRDYEPNYDIATIEGIGRVATVDYDLAVTDNLIKLADEIRVAKGYEPLWAGLPASGPVHGDCVSQLQRPFHRRQ